MVNLEVRVLGTSLLELRLGRKPEEHNDEWWRGYQDGRWDRESAENGTTRTTASDPSRGAAGSRCRCRRRSRFFATPKWATKTRTTMRLRFAVWADLEEGE